VRSCPICDRPKSALVFSLRPTPLEDSLQESEEKARNLQFYPLDLRMCGNCGHVFVSVEIPSADSYMDYHFSSATSPGLVGTMNEIAKELWFGSGASAGDRVLDIGSNDGTLLSLFQSYGAEVLGVEPSQKQADRAEQLGIRTLTSYLSEDLIRTDLRAFEPKIVTIHNVLANTPQPGDFLKMVAELCTEDTLISVVTGYHPDQFAGYMFDWVYHEHLSYFSALDLSRLAEDAGLYIEKVRRLPYKGGSLQVTLRKIPAAGHHPVGEIDALVAWERWSDVRSTVLFERISARISANKHALLSYLDSVLDPSHTLVGYGSSHSTTTLLCQFGLHESLGWLVEDNASRHGLYSPGAGLKVKPPSSLLEKDVVVVILAWQHDWRILRRLGEIGFAGSVVRMMPEFEVISLEAS